MNWTRVFRAQPMAVLLTVLLSACDGASTTDVTAPMPATPPARDAWTVRTVGDQSGLSSDPVDMAMGVPVPDALMVRVTAKDGTVGVGVPVRFMTTASLQLLANAVGTSNSVNAGLTRDVTVLSDANGIASPGTMRADLRDTVLTRHIVSVYVGDDASPVAHTGTNATVHATMHVRAWRDLSQFGGMAPLVLSTLPIDRRRIDHIRPLGTFSTDGALPSADAIVVPTAGASAPPVRAMAAGLVTEMDVAAGAVTMRVRNDVRVQYTGVDLASSVFVGAVLREGDPVGTVVSHAGGSTGLAVRVLDGAVQRSNWVRPERYGARRSAAFFVRYLADSVRSEAWALVRRASPDLEGRIDYDREGRLVGTWFDGSAPVVIAGVPARDASGQSARAGASRPGERDPGDALAPVSLTFAYDAERPGQVRIAAGTAVGARLSMSGVKAVGWDDPDPARVSHAQGVVRYALYAEDDDSRIGTPIQWLLVQLMEPGRLRVEVVPGRAPAVFSERAITLVR